MKHLKNIAYLLIFAVAFSFTACEEDSELLIIDNSTSEIEFTNSFLGEYILTFETSSNLGERFTWNTPDFGIPTSITYDLEKSLSGDFTDAEVVGSTGNNEIAITIGDMLDYANELGLDNDPETQAPDTGVVNFRVVARTGVDGPSAVSGSSALTLFLPEVTTGEDAVCEFEQLFAVGAGLSQTKWTWDNPAVFVCVGTGVYKANVHLTTYVDDDGNFRFFTENSAWGSGRNYPWYADAGYTIDPNLINAEDNDSNFRFTGATGHYLLTVDDVNKTITLGTPEGIGMCEFTELFAVGAGITQTGWTWDNPATFWCDGNGVYSYYLHLTTYVDDDGNFRFFTENSAWDSGRNYPWYADAGYTIDSNLINAEDNDSNFRFIGPSGYYVLSVDDVNKTVTLAAVPD